MINFKNIKQIVENETIRDIAQFYINNFDEEDIINIKKEYKRCNEIKVDYILTELIEGIDEEMRINNYWKYEYDLICKICHEYDFSEMEIKAEIIDILI